MGITYLVGYILNTWLLSWNTNDIGRGLENVIEGEACRAFYHVFGPSPDGARYVTTRRYVTICYKA